jgi:LDH2 family malate/lactate/ureidoglycolate dehydrogenase
MIDCFLASRTSFWNAKAMSDLLLEADYRGHYSHGMNRLGLRILNKFYI